MNERRAIHNNFRLRDPNSQNTDGEVSKVEVRMEEEKRREKFWSHSCVIARGG
jgi:hypothetical protein